MKMNTKPIVNLEVTLDELSQAFEQLPAASEKESDRHAVKFSVLDDYGKPCERQLLFMWHADSGSWQLDAKAHDLLITSK